MSDQLQAALSLLDRGLPLIPLKPRSNEPAMKDWQAHVVRDEPTARKVWGLREPDFNLAIPMGEGLIAIDIDMKNGRDGESTFKALAVSDETFTTKTAHGGRHAIYRTEIEVANSRDKLGSGLDIRSRHGYVVAPGSVLADGSPPYAVEHDRDLATADACGLRVHLERLRLSLRDGREVGANTDDIDNHLARLNAQDWLSRAPGAVEGMGGDNYTYLTACRLKDMGLSEGACRELMAGEWNERCKPPWSIAQLSEKVASAYRYGQNAVGVDHPKVALASLENVIVEPAHRSTSRFIRHGDWWDPDVPWLYYGFAPVVGSLLLVGPSNSGKSFLILEWARSLATGRAFFGIEPDEKGGAIILYAGTEGAGFLQRLAALGEKEHMPVSALRIGNLSAGGAINELRDLIRQEREHMDVVHGLPLKMIVLETLAASGLLRDESNNAECGLAMAAIGALASEFGVLFVVVHHPPKSESMTARGGGALEAAADYVLHIRHEGGSSVRQVEMTHARNAQQRKIGSFSLLPVKVATDARGRPVTSMALSMGEPERMHRGRTPPRYTDFLRAMELVFSEPVKVEDEPGVEYRDMLHDFYECVSDIKDRGNAHRLWAKNLAYAASIGVVEEKLFQGVRYLIRKEFTDD